MAHYAEIDQNGIVIRVIPGVDETEKNGELIYQTETGNAWRRTSYNTRGGVHIKGGTPFRKNYAGIGYTYDPVRDAFIPPQPSPEHILNEETCLWENPQDTPQEEPEIPVSMTSE